MFNATQWAKGLKPSPSSILIYFPTFLEGSCVYPESLLQMWSEDPKAWIILKQSLLRLFLICSSFSVFNSLIEANIKVAVCSLSK